MSQSIADRSRFRLAALFASTCTLTACGGGGGGGGDASSTPPPPPPPAAALTLATCLQDPSGVTNTYLNTTRPRREWKAATFLGDNVIARMDFVDATATTPSRAFYYKLDTAAQTLATVGHEDFNAAGGVLIREQFIGLANSTALAAGQSETKTYTVKTLVPATVADRTERTTLTYETNEVITLTGGRVDTCRIKTVLESIAAGGAATQVSTETQHLVPGFGFVKSYYKPTLASFIDRNQTYLTELVSSTRTLSLAAPTADMAPPLSQCASLATNLNLVITASSPGEATSAFRSSSASTFNGSAATAMERRNAATNVRSRVDYSDPTLGFLKQVGWETYDGTTGTQVVTRRARSGRPDLRSTSPLASVDYTETYTVLVPTGVAPSSSTDRFTFDGYTKVTTPAGTFDTCKVTFHYGADNFSETFYHAPNLHWVRLDTTLADGTRTTRELISK